MSDEKKVNDGGPAFPETRWDDKTRQDVQWTGMTLRDWFAGQALAGLCSNPKYAEALAKADTTLGQHVGITAFGAADAMLREREARG